MASIYINLLYAECFLLYAQYKRLYAKYILLYANYNILYAKYILPAVGVITDRFGDKKI
jgi:hypothetical protein